MNKNEEGGNKCLTTEAEDCTKDIYSTKNKGKSRGKKRKRRNCDGSSEDEDVLPDNSVEVDRSLHAVAIKNNLDETSVRKIIKKVVTNDRVLALVKMREEEDSGPDEDSLRPKLTRAKVKELMKVSPKTTAWNLENLELTPIKHIPVKTRPEVKALIAQELPEDEDDEEYEPTHDDVPSDDDQGLESCSDLDSQPRTPATPRSQHSISPKVVKDGPFKVPQDVSTPTRRKLDLEEEATIALRTRSKLSLSATSIEHIESTFVPPDDIPMPDVDTLWNQFLNECLNPASTSKNEEDDETDPEYNIAADPDAHDEDEEALMSITRIPKKELNDLITELFNIIPESTEELLDDNLTNSVLTDHSQTEISHWEGKQEPNSDDESSNRRNLSDRITFEKSHFSRVSIGKSEPPNEEVGRETVTAPAKDGGKNMSAVKPGKCPTYTVSVQEQSEPGSIESAPPLLQDNLKCSVRNECVHIRIDQPVRLLPEQVLILQQQLRQHVQLAATAYLQLYIHPIHWAYAAKYKEYLESLLKMAESKANSVVDVCNLKPAVELITTWEKTVSVSTPENEEIVKFIKDQSKRQSRRVFHKNLYVGEFHDTLMGVVANSSVFLYPYLLPAMPYRPDHPRRFCYLHSEDEYIALGMQQFWQYVRDNPAIYKPGKRQGRFGLTLALQLVAQHMLPWVPFTVLHNHVQTVRKVGDKQNPINIYMRTNSVSAVKHKLLPYNPRLTLYEQPEHEVPRIWVRYLAKTSKRFKSYLYKRTHRTGMPPLGVDIEPGRALAEPSKPPLPIDFTNEIVANTSLPASTGADKFDIQIANSTNVQIPVSNLYRFVKTSSGAYLEPLSSVTITVNSNTAPISAQTHGQSDVIANNLPETSKTIQANNVEHCSCCLLIRKICKRQTVITEYFGRKKESNCGCKDKKYPKVSKRLKLLADSYLTNYYATLKGLETKIELLANKDNLRLNGTDKSDINNIDSNLDDIAYVRKFQIKLMSLTTLSRIVTKRKIHNILSMFDPYTQDPLELTAMLHKAVGTDLVEVYKEFLGFLTPEQADKIDSFKDYFIRNCIEDLIEKVEDQVKNIEKRRTILEKLRRVFCKNVPACELCTDILRSMHDYPSLAQYVFSLFPHRKEKSSSEQQSLVLPPPTEEPSLIEQTPVAIPSNMMEDANMEYEDDQAMSEDDDNGGNKSPSDEEDNRDSCRPIKTENITMECSTPTSERVSLVVTVSKTEVQEFNESSNSSLKIMFEDDIVKLEAPEWKRDEDKLILEILKEYLTPEVHGMEDKTILEIIDEKNIVDIVADGLTDKSKEDIRKRILYLLQIC